MNLREIHKARVWLTRAMIFAVVVVLGLSAIHHREQPAWALDNLGTLVIVGLLCVGALALPNPKFDR